MGTIKFANNGHSSDYVPPSGQLSTFERAYASIEGIVRHTRYRENHCPDLAFFVKNKYDDATPVEALTIIGGQPLGKTGYVGIGTTNPSSKLHVNGITTISNRSA